MHRLYQFGQVNLAIPPQRSVGVDAGRGATASCLDYQLGPQEIHEHGFATRAARAGCERGMTSDRATVSKESAKDY